MNDFYKNTQELLKEAYSYIRNEEYDSLFEEYLNPDKVFEADVAVEKTGGISYYKAYRSQFSNVLGPYKGGIRFHENVTKDEVIALSMLMSIKTSLLGLPLGGGKGGIAINPKDLSRKELQGLSRGYVKAFSKDFGPNKDIPAPDVNTDSQVMAWMIDEYERIVGYSSPGTFTGKPIAIGGSKGRNDATSLGGLISLRTYLKDKGEDLMGKTIIIQGSGNVGLNFAELASRDGAKIIGISDSSINLFDINGLNIKEISELKNSKKSLQEYIGGERITKDELFAKEVDILVPAALENQITETNAANIKAKLILELANGPITREADIILTGKLIPIIPDVLANAGGVTVSYFEQVQNSHNYYWEESEVKEKLEKFMQKATTEVIEVSKQFKLTLRTAAIVLGLKRIMEASFLRRR